MIFISCKKEVDNPYFSSDEIYDIVLKSVDDIHKDVSKTDKIFYVFNRFDTLIVMSTKYENIIKPTFMIKKEGTFYYKGNKVIITKPYHPQYNILKQDNKLKPNDIYPYLDFYNGNDYQKGLVYKIKNLNNLELIHSIRPTKYILSKLD